MSFPSFLSLLFLSFSLSQIFDSSWLRCTSSSPTGLHFTDRSVVNRSSVVGVAWIVCLKGIFPSPRVNSLITVVQQGSAAVCPFDPSADRDLGYGDISMGSMLLFLHEIVLVGLQVFAGRSGDVYVSLLGLFGGGVVVTTSSLFC
ncbi:hypothetical protein RchiOBHm_Chr6g0312951 [Rosa chinensis]|uniref:Uncharacterized protein n=1 Tax=Rosa chinensis TaxID=74649 RepID=A0A2P6Q1V5_ROSCH|nr:hypothetical protein RchiOBHm_Chr6g0312951 [Rosa chinensis]